MFWSFLKKYAQKCKVPDISVDAIQTAVFIHCLNQISEPFDWISFTPLLEAKSNHLAKKQEIKLLSIV